MSAPLLFRSPVPVLALGAALLLAGCSDPPPPAPEPTGADLERAWRIAVGSDPLDQTIAQLYSQALNAHETPAAVVESDDDEATALAVALGEEGDEQPEAEEAEDERYEIVIARTMPLAEALDPEGYAELTRTGPGDAGPAAAPEELTEVVEAQLSDAELREPAEAVMRSAMLITSVTEADLELEADEDTSLEELASQCDHLVVGSTDKFPAAQSLLEEVYDCQPEDWVVEEADTLIESLITAEIDAALMVGSHPDSAEHALISLADSLQAFPQDQYAPVVASRIGEQVPDVVDEISAALNDEALELLRRLIHGEQGLAPQEAAEYWLVENDFIAEPEHWG